MPCAIWSRSPIRKRPEKHEGPGSHGPAGMGARNNGQPDPVTQMRQQGAARGPLLFLASKSYAPQDITAAAIPAGTRPQVTAAHQRGIAMERNPPLTPPCTSLQQPPQPCSRRAAHFPGNQASRPLYTTNTPAPPKGLVRSAWATDVNVASNDNSSMMHDNIAASLRTVRIVTPLNSPDRISWMG